MVAGIKSDYTTKLAFPFSSMAEAAEDALRAHEVTVKLRALYQNHVAPLVMKEFGFLFEHISGWVKQFDIHLFADFVSAVGLAELYWPRSHVDADSWYTILVVIDLGRGLEAGGDFSLARHGHILKAEHGDVFFFNPSHVHSCTEPAPHPNGSRLFISFYCKKATVHAGAVASAMHARVGNAPLSLCRLR